MEIDSCFDDKLESTDNSEKEGLLQPRNREPRKSIPKVLVLMLLTVSHILIAVLTYGLTELQYAESLSPWMSSLDRSFHTAVFNKFERPNAFTAPVADAGDAVQDKWIDLGAYAKPVLIPQKYARDFDIDPEKHVLIDPRTHNVPYAGFPANIQAIHQLHCLDFLRQALFFNHQYYRDIHSIAWNETDPRALATHILHCVDSLRQMIMCEADARVLPYIQGKWSPDFARTKRCRNFTALRNFAVEHQWEGADEDSMDDHHPFQRTTASPEWPSERLWRGL